jgi:hypothetical protein
MTADLSGARWRKASYTTSGNGNCVEVASLGSRIAIRDSKHPNPHGPVLVSTTDQFAAFVRWVKAL